MIVLRSLLFTLVFYIGSLVPVLFGLAAIPFGSKGVRYAGRMWAGFHHWCAANLLGIRVRVEGTIPQTPVLFAIKHESMFETIEILNLIRDPAVLVKKELTEIPLWGRVAVLHGVIAIDREGGAKALRLLIRAARDAAADGRSLVIFPEGTRVPHGQRPPLRAGFAGLYRQIGLPVVPVAMDSGRVSPRKSFLKRPGVVTFRFGQVIPTGLDRTEAEAIVHREINVLNA